MKKTGKLLSVIMLLLMPFFAVSTPVPHSTSNNVATVHIYRPSNVVGFGWVFNLKGNGEKLAKIGNGKHVVLQLNPGQTEFSIKGKIVEINLEAGKTYYLRTALIRNMLLGKPDLVEVTESYARNELGLD